MARKKVSRKNRAKQVQASITEYRLEIVRERVAQIAREHDNFALPAAVVDDARDETSPLHDFFTWDDSEAAQKYRIVQARHLIARISIRRVDRDQESRVIRPVRQYQSLPDDRRSGRGYRTIQEILSDPEAREALLAQVLRELATIRRRYEELCELGEIWDSIAAAVAEREDEAASASRASEEQPTIDA